jgi:protein TonB
MRKTSIYLILGLALLIFLSCGYYKTKEKKTIDNRRPDEPYVSDEHKAFDTPPELLEAPDPEYPEVALKNGIQGYVWVKALVDKKGNVRDAIIIKKSGVDVGFEESALKAAKRRKYSPALKDEKPVKTWVAYKVIFDLRNK